MSNKYLSHAVYELARKRNEQLALQLEKGFRQVTV